MCLDTMTHTHFDAILAALEYLDRRYAERKASAWSRFFRAIGITWRRVP